MSDTDDINQPAKSGAVKPGMEIPAELYQSVRELVPRRRLKMKDAVRQAFELWVSDVYGEIAVEAQNAGLSVAEIIEQLWNTRKSGGSGLGKSRRPRRGYVEVPDYLEAKVRNIVAILSDPNKMGVFTSMLEAMSHDDARAAEPENPEQRNPISKPNNG